MDQDATPKSSLLGRLWIPLVVLALGLVLSASLARLLRETIQKDARQRFEKHAEQATEAIADRIQSYNEALYALRALFHASASVTQQTFRDFVAKLELGTRYPALRVLNYAAYVRHGERNALIAQIRGDRTGGPQARAFTIRPPGDRPEYWVITHLAPIEGNEEVFGLDIGAPPGNSATLERGRDSGELVSSGRVIRLGDGADHLAMRIAVYRAGYPTATLEQRRAAYLGSVGAGFRVAELMRGVLDAQNLQHIGFRVLDLERASGKSAPIFEHAPSNPGGGPVYTALRQTEMGGRLWQLEFRAPEASLLSGYYAQLPWLALGSGVLISVLLAAVLFSMTASRQRALALARNINLDLHEQEARLAEAQRMARLGSWEIAGQTREMVWSAELYRVLGLEPHGRRATLDDFLQAVHPGDRQKVRDLLRLGTEPGSVLELEHRLLLPDGAERWALTQAKLEEVLAEGGVWRGTTMDITERKRAQLKLQTEQQVTRILASGAKSDRVLAELLRTLGTRLDMICAVHWMSDAQHALRCQRVWCSDKVERSDRLHLQLEVAGSELARRAVHKRAVVVAAELPRPAPPLYAGGAAPVAMHAVAALPIVAANRVHGVIELYGEAPAAVEASLADLLGSISAQLGQHHQKTLAEEALASVAAHDALTGLPNRLELEHRLSLALERARRDRAKVALLCIDLDRFSLLQSSLGQDAAERFLQECARRIAQSLRRGDTVARARDDDFLVLLEGVGTVQEVITVVRKLQERLGQPLLADAREFTPTASVGVSVYPADGIDAATLIKNADMAMSQAMQGARGACRFFSAAMQAAMEERLYMEAALRRAMEGGEFVLYYQARRSLRTGRIAGAEALLLWRHPERGLLAAPEFLALAEDSGLGAALGEWVLRTACERAQALRRRGLAELRISVCLSARQLAAAAVAGDVARVLASTGLPAQALELEVAEALLMENPAQASQILHELKGLRIGLAIDGFGAGGASLSLLKMFPVDGLKLDRSLVAGIPADREDAAISHTLIQLAHQLGMRSIAGGVETREQLQWLEQAGCDEVQGEIVGAPVSGEALMALLAPP